MESDLTLNLNNTCFSLDFNLIQQVAHSPLEDKMLFFSTLKGKVLEF